MSYCTKNVVLQVRGVITMFDTHSFRLLSWEKESLPDEVKDTNLYLFYSALQEVKGKEREKVLVLEALQSLIEQEYNRQFFSKAAATESNKGREFKTSSGFVDGKPTERLLVDPKSLLEALRDYNVFLNKIFKLKPTERAQALTFFIENVQEGLSAKERLDSAFTKTNELIETFLEWDNAWLENLVTTLNEALMGRVEYSKYGRPAYDELFKRCRNARVRNSAGEFVLVTDKTQFATLVVDFLPLDSAERRARYIGLLSSEPAAPETRFSMRSVLSSFLPTASSSQVSSPRMTAMEAHLAFYRDDPRFLTSLPVDCQMGNRKWCLMSNDRWKEHGHSYIQWLFPIRTFSKYNSTMPKFSDEEYKQFVEVFKREGLSSKLTESFEAMLAFYGLERASDGFDCMSSFNEKVKLWLHDGLGEHAPHNFLRITRIITSLRDLGCEQDALAFANFMCSPQFTKAFREAGATSQQLTHLRNSQTFWKNSSEAIALTTTGTPESKSMSSAATPLKRT